MKLESNHLGSLVTGKLSQHVAEMVQQAMQMVRCIDPRREVGSSLAAGASIGAVQILASTLGKGDSGASSVNNDTMLLAALLTVSCVDVARVADNANVVANSFCLEPSTYLTAFSMFEKITGRPATSVVHDDVASYAAIGSQEGSALLNQVCANNRPA